MENRQNILFEIKEIAPALENISKTMPFQVPEGYFEMMPFEICARLGLGAQKPVVPDGYFDSFPALMLAKAKAQEKPPHELETVAPALISISRQMPFTVPADYFENFTVAIFETNNTGTVPVIPIHSKRKTWMWAAAASVILLLGMFAWKFLWYSPATPAQTVIATTGIDSVATTELAMALEQISDTTINTELSDKGIANDAGSALYYLDTENFETALKDFSDAEIKAQLSLEGIPSKKS